VDRQANRLISDFVARKTRERVKDPVVAEKLVPKTYGFGTRRVPLESGYFEVYNQPNVELVDLTETPIARITPTGIETSAGDYQFDMIIYATGFDAITGAARRARQLPPRRRVQRRLGHRVDPLCPRPRTDPHRSHRGRLRRLD
jgi:cation diffusion facilitator CzcD-associated flavoprotein CzcO